MPKKTSRSIRVKKTGSRQSSGSGRMEMTDQDRDRFLAALNRTSAKPLPELERAARLHALATKGAA